MLCDDFGFHLAQDFYWWNPSKLPTPAEWVTVRRIRVKDAINNVWWLSKSPWPRASNRRVLQPYSESMKSLLKNGYKAKKRPSGHDISEKFSIDNKASIPPNLLAIPNTESNSYYLRYCKEHGLKPNPARYPSELPSFFVKMLTEKGDFVLDPFAGSCVTGEVCERLGRKWTCVELIEEYLKGAIARFKESPKEAKRFALKNRNNIYYKIARPGSSHSSSPEKQLPKDGGKERRKTKVNCYFDTSIYNNILDSPDKDLIINKIKKKNITAIPSLVNLCEILQNKDLSRKKSLLGIYHEIRNNYHALKPSTILLRDTIVTLQEGNLYVEMNMPVVINEKTEQDCKEVLKNPGKLFDGYAIKARKWLYKDKKISIPPDVKKFFKISYDEKRIVLWIANFKKACIDMGIKDLKLNDDLIRQFITNPNSFWKYYLDTELLIFYRRAMRTEGYGKKSNPGGADLEQVIYLGWADIFVIQDNNFYNFMKELKDINNYQKEIFTFEEFREHLGVVNKEER